MPDSAWARGIEVYSLPEEQSTRVEIGWTRAAWESFLAWREALIRAYCEAREALQVANGETPKPAGVCDPLRSSAPNMVERFSS